MALHDPPVHLLLVVLQLHILALCIIYRRC
jgi:hypothetical protein